MKKSLVFRLVVFLFIGLFSTLIFGFTHMSDNDQFKGKTITLQSSDGVTVTADIYLSDNESDPFILLFHQARYSRGEYRPTAPKLNTLGFSCIAIDQRSGKEVNGIENDTHKDATAKGKPTKYADAYPDLEATLSYVKTNYPSKKVIVCGSSYSASLVFILGQKHKDQISGIISFSPSEYFKFENKQIKDFAKEIDCPVFISSAKNEHNSWKEIYEQIPSAEKAFYLPETKGFHGSRALWESKEGNEKCWKALEDFLINFKKEE